MDLNRFTEKAQQALSAAQTKAVRYGHQQVDVEHLLASLLEQERGLATSILNKAEVNVDGLKARVEQELERMPIPRAGRGAPEADRRDSTQPAETAVARAAHRD
jgi:ATP-dependent Clp protease ATP-binding subunit ClpB